MDEQTCVKSMHKLSLIKSYILCFLVIENVHAMLNYMEQLHAIISTN